MGRHIMAVPWSVWVLQSSLTSQSSPHALHRLLGQLHAQRQRPIHQALRRGVRDVLRTGGDLLKAERSSHGRYGREMRKRKKHDHWICRGAGVLKVVVASASCSCCIVGKPGWGGP